MSSINGNDAIEYLKREVNEIKNESVILKQETRLIKVMLNDVILNNRSLKKNIQSLTDENNYLHDSLSDMGVHYNNLNQYTRRNNIEIMNISENITPTEPGRVCVEGHEILGRQYCVVRPCRRSPPG